MHIITTLAFLSTINFSFAVTINQKQTGETNIHVNVKDFKIIALLKNTKEEYMDYDYAYDYSEMTIKPQNSSTVSSLLHKLTTEAFLENSTETTTQQVEMTPPVKNTSVAMSLQNDTIEHNTETPVTTILASLSPSEISSTEGQGITSTRPGLNGTECRKGFIVNKKGECELKLQNSSTNALLKLVKLSQKLKLRREN